MKTNNKNSGRKQDRLSYNRVLPKKKATREKLYAERNNPPETY